jgi:hypothetical protein
LPPALKPPPPPPAALPPLSVDSSEIGALAVTGACRDSTGARSAPPTCSPPDEPPID